MKNLLTHFGFILILFSLKFSYAGLPWEYDLYCENYTQHEVKVQVYPVGMVFNGNNHYNLFAAVSEVDCNPIPYAKIFNYINGSSYFNFGSWTHYWRYSTVQFGHEIGFRLDPYSSSPCVGHISRGLFKLEFQHTFNGDEPEYVDSCLIEFDGFTTGPGDLYVEVYGETWQTETFQYKFQNGPYFQMNCRSTNQNDYYIRSWINGKINRGKLYGPGSSDNYYVYSSSDFWNTIPLDSRLDCNNQLGIQCTTYVNNQNQKYPYPWEPIDAYKDDRRTGFLTLNLSIQQPVYTPIQFWQMPTQDENQQWHYTYPAPLIVEPYVKLQITNGNSLTLSDLSNIQHLQDFQMLINTNASLILGQNSIINIKNKNHLVLDCQSNLICPTSGTPPTIYIYAGGTFCNVGANKTGFLNIHYYQCTYPGFAHS